MIFCRFYIRSLYEVCQLCWCAATGTFLHALGGDQQSWVVDQLMLHVVLNLRVEFPVEQGCIYSCWPFSPHCCRFWSTAWWERRSAARWAMFCSTERRANFTTGCTLCWCCEGLQHAYLIVFTLSFCDCLSKLCIFKCTVLCCVFSLLHAFLLHLCRHDWQTVLCSFWCCSGA